MLFDVLLFGEISESAKERTLKVIFPDTQPQPITTLNILNALKLDDSAPGVQVNSGRTGSAFQPPVAHWKELINACVLAVNQEYVALDQEAAVKPTDEIALIPPISGG